jgi:hypothetical protein
MRPFSYHLQILLLLNIKIILTNKYDVLIALSKFKLFKIMRNVTN